MESAYLDLLEALLSRGKPRKDRTGVGTRGLFGYQMRFDLRESFPLLTTKKLFTRAIVEELVWFLSGETTVAPLQEAGVTIWDEWATAEQCARFGRSPGDLGPVYGHQWRNFGATVQADGRYGRDGVDQIEKVLTQIRHNPDSRRIVVSSWNPREAEAVALPPCHTLFQFHVQDGELSCQLYQRSGDVFLGVPFNIASYALLTCLIAKVTHLRPGDFIHTLGDAHLYENHLEQAKLQLSRSPRPPPKLWLDDQINDLFKFRSHHARFDGYDPHPAIRAPVAV